MYRLVGIASRVTRRSRSSAKGVGDGTQALSLTAGAASVFGCDTRKCFCKGFARASRCIAEETPHLHEQLDGASLAWQIGKSACVPTMDAVGGLMTIRARHFRKSRCNDQGKEMVLDEDIFHQQMSWERKQRG